MMSLAVKICNNGIYAPFSNRGVKSPSRSDGNMVVFHEKLLCRVLYLCLSQCNTECATELIQNNSQILCETDITHIFNEALLAKRSSSRSMSNSNLSEVDLQKLQKCLTSLNNSAVSV
jgi:hypothetical protein